VSYLLEHPAKVLGLAGDHAALVASALVVALAIALPLGIYAARRPRVATLLLGVLGVIYTIPSLALLAVLVRWLGIGVGSIFVALIAYAQFMLARNIVAGINGVDPAQVDAARGLGMSRAQVLLRVELPQALPVMLGGVRVAAIAMIAIATLAGYVGGGGLGVLIFTGLALHNNAMIVAGSIAASVLAIAVDASLRVVERLARR
jgi:osmoprotectant transport system permease protein